MKKIGLLIFCLVFVQNARAQRTREPLNEIEQKLSDELKNNKEFVQVGCGRRQHADTDVRDTSYKLKAVEAFKGYGENLKLKKKCGTIEGDPIFSYLSVGKGKASLFIDTSQDDFGPRRVYSYQCDTLDFGVYFNDMKLGMMVFQKIEDGELKDQQTVLRCLSDAKEIIF